MRLSQPMAQMKTCHLINQIEYRSYMRNEMMYGGMYRSESILITLTRSEFRSGTEILKGTCIFEPTNRNDFKKICRSRVECKS
jgi:hypothetical protein